MSLSTEQLYSDPTECERLFTFLNSLEIEYHKEYKGMYGRMMKVPRGQASFTLHDGIHYNYKVSGGSPPNRVMCEQLKTITRAVNERLSTHFNTILMNVYRGGEDCIAFHKDNEAGWVAGSGFATLSFGEERDFQVRDNTTKEVSNILHKDGMCIYLPYPMNSHYTHGLPKRKRAKGTRISLTFREIVEG